MLNILFFGQILSNQMVHVQYWLSNLTAFVELLFFAGIVFGWPSLQYVLEREGYFSYLCVNSTNELENLTEETNLPIRCAEQQANFNLIFTLTLTSFYGLSFPLGYLLDRYGTWIFRSFCSVLYTVGIVLLTVSSPSTSVLLYPAFIFLGISGLGLLMSNFQIANFAQSYRGMVITLMNGLRGSSVLVFFLVKKGFDAGADLKLLLQILCWITLYQWVRTFIFMPRKAIPFPLKKSTLEYGYKEWICFKKRQIAEHFVPVSLFVVGASEKVADKIVEMRKNQNEKETSFKDCLKTFLFWTNVFHISVVSLRLNVVFGTLQAWLRSFVHPDDISKLTDDFGIFLLFGGLVAPINGILFDSLVKIFSTRTKTKKAVTLKACFISMIVTSTLATLLSVMMALFIPYGVFVFQLLTRSFVYGGSVTFISTNFPSQHIGKLFGLTNFISGMISLLQFALFQLAIAVDPTFFYINIGLTLAVVTTFIHPILIFYSIRKLNRSEDNKEDNKSQKGVKKAMQFANLFGVAFSIPQCNNEEK